MKRSSFIWSAVRNWLPRLGTIITFFVLARLLDKSEIGLFSATYALVLFTEILSDNGLGEAIIRVRVLTDSLATTIVLINFILALVLYAILVVFATQIGLMMGVNGIEPVLNLVGIYLVLNSLGYVPQSILRRTFQFRRLAIRSLASTLIGAATGLGLAFAGYGIYSMVWQLLATALVNVAFLWFPIVLRVAKPNFYGLDEVLPYVLRIFTSRILYYTSLRSIEIIVPVFYGPAALATYIMGSRLPAVLTQMLTGVMIDVSLPHYAHISDQQDEVKNTYYKGLRSFGAISTPAFVGLGLLATQVSRIAFGQNGIGVERVLLMTSLLGAVQAIGYSNEVMLNGSGRSHIMLRIQFVATLTTLGCFGVFSALGNTSIDLLITAYVGLQIAVITLGIGYGAYSASFDVLKVFSSFAPSFLSAFVAAALVKIVAFYGPPLYKSNLIQALILGPIYMTFYLTIIYVFFRKTFESIISMLRRRQPM